MIKQFSFGEAMTPILEEIEGAIAEYEAEIKVKPNYPVNALKSVTRIFASVIMDKIWELQESEDMDNDTRRSMAEKCGQDIRKLVKVYTNIDTYEI